MAKTKSPVRALLEPDPKPLPVEIPAEPVIYCRDCHWWDWKAYGPETHMAPCGLSARTGFDKPIVTTSLTTCHRAEIAK